MPLCAARSQRLLRDSRHSTPGAGAESIIPSSASTRSVPLTTASIDGSHMVTVHGWSRFVALVDDLISA